MAYTLSGPPLCPCGWHRTHRWGGPSSFIERLSVDLVGCQTMPPPFFFGLAEAAPLGPPSATINPAISPLLIVEGCNKPLTGVAAASSRRGICGWAKSVSFCQFLCSPQICDWSSGLNDYMMVIQSQIKRENASCRRDETGGTYSSASRTSPGEK